jgi:hypothetical protein
MSEAFKSLGIQFTLVGAKIQFVFSKLVEDKFEMLLVILHTLAKHEDVVQVYMEECTYVFAENGVHQSLESERSVAVSLLHH